MRRSSAFFAKFRVLDLGIKPTPTESLELKKVYKENREKFDFSLHQINAKGQLQIVQPVTKSSELAEFVKISHHEWKTKGLDPVKFIQSFGEHKFYQEDQELLIKLLHRYCLFVMNSEIVHPELNKIALDYAATVLLRIVDHSKYNDNSIYCSFKNDFTYDGNLALEERLHNLEIKADKILALLPTEKKEGLAFDMFKTLRELFYYVRNMGLEQRKNGPENESCDENNSPKPKF